MLQIERWQENFRSALLFKGHTKDWTREKETGEILSKTHINSLCTVVVSHHVLHKGSTRLAPNLCTIPQGRYAAIPMHAVLSSYTTTTSLRESM